MEPMDEVASERSVAAGAPFDKEGARAHRHVTDEPALVDRGAEQLPGGERGENVS